MDNDIEEEVEMIAAYVNFYKYNKREIDWQKISADFNNEEKKNYSAEEIKSIYTMNFDKSLDDIYLVDKILEMRVQRSNIVANIKWKGFPNDQASLLQLSEIDALIIEEYFDEDKDRFIKFAENLSTGQLRKLEQQTEGHSREVIKALVQQRKEGKPKAESEKKEVLRPEDILGIELLNESAKNTKSQEHIDGNEEKPQPVTHLKAQVQCAQENDEDNYLEQTKETIQRIIDQSNQKQNNELAKLVTVCAPSESLEAIRQRSGLPDEELTAYFNNKQVRLIKDSEKPLAHIVTEEFATKERIVELKIYEPIFEQYVAYLKGYVICAQNTDSEQISLLLSKNFHIIGCLHQDAKTILFIE